MSFLTPRRTPDCIPPLATVLLCFHWVAAGALSWPSARVRPQSRRSEHSPLPSCSSPHSVSPKQNPPPSRSSPSCVQKGRSWFSRSLSSCVPAFHVRRCTLRFEQALSISGHRFHNLVGLCPLARKYKIPASFRPFFPSAKLALLFFLFLTSKYGASHNGRYRPR